MTNFRDIITTKRFDKIDLAVAKLKYTNAIRVKAYMNTVNPAIRDFIWEAVDAVN